ncbi:MAG: hypothetical protein R3224_00015 [Balneolaceae bacterium]|nr:hypothetical protein [Balneolaceae bacterium]
MLKDKNASIRYLMKEMDPSEELLIERAMMDDEDLLIEVESMRRTLKRLDNALPQVDPPRHLTDTIIKKAARRNSARSAFTNLIGSERIRFVAAAASVVFAAIIGLVWYQSTVAGSMNISQSNSANPASVTSSSYVISPVSVNGVEPWIDKNDVIRFSDQFNSQYDQVAYDSILNYSTRKLKPIDDPLQLNNQTRNLQLTGTEQ